MKTPLPLTTPTIHTRRYASPCGELLLGCCDGKLCLCDWATPGRHRERVDRRLRRSLAVRWESGGDDPLLQEAVRQLDEYFGGSRQQFTLPLRLVGSAFQQSVWHALLAIPYGETCSYACVAAQLGLPRAVRAVAQAIGANAISLLVPCHRVVGSNGSLTGYAGSLPAKEFLLMWERRNKKRPTEK